MGSYDGAETCELVGLLLLHEIKQQIAGNFGLYRDDGLGTIAASPQKTERVKKELCSLFKNLGLKITVETNQK